MPAPRGSARAKRAAPIMAIDHRVRGRAWMAAAALLAGVPAAFAAPLTLAPAVEREIIAPEGAQLQPSPADEEGATGRFAESPHAPDQRDFVAAHHMLRLPFQAPHRSTEPRRGE